MKAEITMKLKSDAIPSSGASLAGIVDREVTVDRYGIPYIPAKRLKGVMREAAEDLALAGLLKVDPGDLFGQEGQKETCGFILDNGIHPDTKLLRNLVDWAAANKDARTKAFISSKVVMNYFTYERQQTAIGTENNCKEVKGVAKRNSLRISRVLRHGLSFQFQLECPPEHMDDMEKICKAVRCFGASRNRGFGQVTLSLARSSETSPSCASAQSRSQPAASKPACMTIHLENHGPLLVTQRPGKSQITESYIPGAFLLGAMAHTYLKTGGQADEAFRRLFLSGEVRFSNLYPAASNEALDFQPAPRSIRKVKTVKDPAKRNTYTAEYYDHVLLDEQHEESDQELLDCIIFKGGPGACIALRRDKFETSSVRAAVEAHHRRHGNRAIAKATEQDQNPGNYQDDSGAFFQFVVLEPDQHFRGTIKGSMDQLETLRDLLAGNGIVRLGKSKTGQYGKCRVTLDPPQAKPGSQQHWKDETACCLILRSDTVLLNEYGYPDPTCQRLCKDLAQRFGVPADKLDLVKSFAAADDVGGFLGEWLLPRMHHQALAAGTVLRLKNNSGQELQLDLLEQPFGIRTEDGYGVVEVYTNEDEALYKAVLDKKSVVDFPTLQEPTRRFISWAVERKTREVLIHEAVKQAAACKVPNNHFLGRLLAMVEDAGDCDDLVQRIQTFKETARKEFDKMKRQMLFDAAQQDQEKCWNEWEEKLKDARGKAPQECAHCVAFDNAQKFELYKLYARTLLTKLKLRNRPEKGGTL